MDFNLLLQTGLSRNEALIYLHLAEHGSASPLTLARSLHLPRSTIYSAVETLEGRNLLRREKKSGAAIFKAQDPSALLHTLDKQAREISAKREVTHKVIAELTPLLTRTNYILPKIEVVDGFAKVERFVFDNLGRWRDSI